MGSTKEDKLDKIEFPENAEHLRDTVRSARNILKDLNHRILVAEQNEKMQRPFSLSNFSGRNFGTSTSLKRDREIIQEGIVQECAKSLNQLKDAAKEELQIILRDDFDIEPEKFEQAVKDFVKAENSREFDIKQDEFKIMIQAAQNPKHPNLSPEEPVQEPSVSDQPEMTNTERFFQRFTRTRDEIISKDEGLEPVD